MSHETKDIAFVNLVAGILREWKTDRYESFVYDGKYDMIWIEYVVLYM